MFSIRFRTLAFRPDLQVSLRTGQDGWAKDIPGIYANDEWTFDLEEQRYAGGTEFKFVLEGSIWMLGPNLQLPVPQAGSDYVWTEAQVGFPPFSEVQVENSLFAQRYFSPNLDPNVIYDVIVVGSGIGGGIVADELADLGAKVLVLEAGSALFLTHTGNLPRKLHPGQFEKHLWALWGEYGIQNYVNAPGSDYAGAQAFNLGGRSVFWGGFIPRMTWWELAPWPAAVGWDLENFAYGQAEDLLYWPPPPTTYQQSVKSLLKSTLGDYDHFDAPMAVRNVDPARGTLSPGLFSTADLLTEGRLSVDPTGTNATTINLNHAVTRLVHQGGAITEVVAYDLLARVERTYRAKFVVLAAGTVESAKIAAMSNLANPRALIGRGLTDHPVWFTHFSIPVGRPWHRVESSSKTLSRRKDANSNHHPYNVLLELGSDLNQGRYLDGDTLARHRALKGDALLGEIVFLFNAPLHEPNYMQHVGPSYAKPLVSMARSPAADPWLGAAAQLKDTILAQLAAEPLPNDTLDLRPGGLGGVAHEVGTLRLGPANQAVVDENLRWNEHDNLYVCDLSVFPTSPAANPTLTLAALAFRLAGHLKSRM
jgi:GMC oxidoreductase